jgi:plastocyanin
MAMRRTRRRLLGSLLAGGTAILAGCAGDGDTGSDGTTTSPPTTTETTRSTTVEETTTGQPATTTEPEPTTARPTTTEASTQTPDGRTVAMAGSSFSPLRLEVPTGETVVWENEDSYGHTVVAARFHDVAESWDFTSETLGANDTTRYTFESSGVYEYYCDIHGRSLMCGAILVGGATLEQDLPCE